MTHSLRKCVGVLPRGLALSTAAHTMAPGLYKKHSHNFQRDFDPIEAAQLRLSQRFDYE